MCDQQADITNNVNFPQELSTGISSAARLTPALRTSSTRRFSPSLPAWNCSPSAGGHHNPWSQTVVIYPDRRASSPLSPCDADNFSLTSFEPDFVNPQREFSSPMLLGRIDRVVQRRFGVRQVGSASLEMYIESDSSRSPSEAPTQRVRDARLHSVSIQPAISGRAAGGTPSPSRIPD